MTNEDPSSASTVGSRSRTPRQGSGGSPVGSTLSIVLAVIAVVAGFLILRNITDDGGSAGSDAAPTGQPIVPGATTSTTLSLFDTTTTSTTTIPRTVAGATVVVANGNSIGGSAGRMSKTLDTAGYEMGSPVNAKGTLDTTLVYFDASVTSAEAVATSVGIDMGCVDVLAVPTPPPTESGTLGEANVLVVLGNDRADKTLEQMAEEGCGVTVATEAPAESGSDGVIAPTTTTG